MLDYRQNEIIIVENLKNYLTTDLRPCEVIRQNQVSKIPSYPYVSYTITTPINPHVGTYSEAEDGTLYKSIQQTWSFTTQSDDQEEAITLAYKIFDFFSIAAVQLLADNKISVLRVGGISTRDNLITIQYEHRNGLDITFGLLYLVTPENNLLTDVIESVNYKEV